VPLHILGDSGLYHIIPHIVYYCLNSDHKEIESLVFLLDDPEPFVRTSVVSRLTAIGESAVPLLDQARSSTVDKNHKELITDVIRDITFDSFQQEVLEMAEDGIMNLEELEDAVFLFSRFDNPTIRTRPYVQHLDTLAEEASIQVHRADTDRQKMLMLIQHIYSKHQYEGCHSDYLNPRHSYLHHVINDQTGIPLSLAFIILFTARRLQLPFHGLNMPLHFLVKFTTSSGSDILIDPFNNGSIITREQCEQFLKKSRIKVREQFFDTASPYHMFTRFIRNLINGHQELGEKKKASQLSRILSVLESSRGA